MMRENAALDFARRIADDAAYVRVNGSRFVYLSAELVLPVSRADLALTVAESAVARLAANGLSNAEIARVRGASLRTVANQLASVYRKLGVGSRVELVAFLELQGTMVAR